MNLKIWREKGDEIIDLLICVSLAAERTSESTRW